MLTKAVVADRLSVSPRKVDLMLTSGELPLVRIGAAVRLPESAVVAIIDSASAAAAAAATSGGES